MLQGYHQSASTLNLLRAFTKGGFADLGAGARLDAGVRRQLARGPPLRADRRPRSSGRCASWPRAGSTCANPALHQIDIWTSHEGLLLDYEEALTRRDSLTGDWYDCSAHMLWIGERTRQPDGAHVEFLAGVHNPVGVKLGPAATPEDVLELCEALNPDAHPGRLTLITRMGAERVREVLPPLLRAVRDAGHPVVWVCDPMHANTFRDRRGPEDARLRRTSWPRSRASSPSTAPRARGPAASTSRSPATTSPSASAAATASPRSSSTTAYTTLCDPRLNARQSLDLAFHVAELMRAEPAADAPGRSSARA